MTRDERLEANGRIFARWGAAIAWTMGNRGDLAKRCGHAWDRAEPLTNEDFAAGLFRQRGQSRNPAVVLRASGLLGIETDSDQDLLAFQALGLPPTASVRSSGPGRMHFYYRPPEGVYPTHFGFRFEGSRVFADTGRYFVAPPALHPTGVEYTWAEGNLNPAQLSREDFDRLMALTRESLVEQERDFVSADAPLLPGNRRMHMFSTARAMAYRGVPHDAILDSCLRLNEDRCQPPLDRRQVEEQVDSALSRYRTQVAPELGAPTPPDYAPEVIRLSDVLAKARTRPHVDGIPFPTPDYVLARLLPGRLTMLGGYPSDGKSAIAMQTVVSNPDVRTLVYTYEMSDEDIMRRAAAIAGVDWRSDEADSHFDNLDVYVSTERDDIEGIIRRNGPYDLIVVDHLHLLAFEDRRKLEQMSQKFKQWSLELSIPFLVLGQLVQNREYPRPVQSSFRESGMISANADLEMYVWRERNAEGMQTDAAELIIAKDRHEGRTRTELLTWDAEHVCFRPRYHVPEIPHYEVLERDLEPFEDGGAYDTEAQQLGFG